MEGLKRKVDTNRALHYVWLAWKTQGVYPVTNYKLHHYIHAAFTIIVANVLYTSGFILQPFFLNNFQQLLRNLPMNICIVVCGLKFTFLLRMRRQLVKVGDLIAKLDSRSFTQSQKTKLENAVILCQRLAIATMVCYFCVNITALISAVASGRTRLPFEMWLPYDFKLNGLVYWVTVFLQFGIQMYLATQNAGDDVSGPAYLCVIDVHLRVIMERIGNLHYDPKSTDERTRREFLDCLKDHRIVMKIFDILQDTVSYTIFFQVVASVSVILTSAWACLLFTLQLEETVAIIIFIMTEIVQIFPCCYFSDRFMETTDKVVFSIYSSNWMDMSMEMRKCLIIFMQTSQKNKVIIAGKQIPITLSTFLSVMKMTYSLVTVVNRI